MSRTKRFIEKRANDARFSATAGKGYNYDGRTRIVLKAPTGGVPAKDAGINGQGLLCIVCYYSSTGELHETTDTVTCWNPSDEIEQDTYFHAVRMKTQWVADLGGGSGGSAIYQLQSTTTITAAFGLNLGSGSADILELQTGGTAYIALTGTPVDVRNPWEESIELGSMITAHKKNVDGVDYFIVIQASCPTETP